MQWLPRTVRDVKINCHGIYTDDRSRGLWERKILFTANSLVLIFLSQSNIAVLEALQGTYKAFNLTYTC